MTASAFIMLIILFVVLADMDRIERKDGIQGVSKKDKRELDLLKIKLKKDDKP